MGTRGIVPVALVAAMVLAPAHRVEARDGIVGGIVGGIIGGAIVNEANKNRQQQQRTTTVQRAPQVSSATRAANRETQTALNYFGFNAGAPDGVVGRGTRAAMASYQAHLGYPATGDLTPFERDFLVTSYQRALAGGATTAQMISTNPMGAKGLLIVFRDQALGLPPQTAAPGVMAAAPAPAPAEVAPPPPVAAAAPAAPALPNFMGQGAAVSTASLASHCNNVNLVTSTNGGFVTAATMTDPVVALNEQFCLARTYAISTGEDLAAQVPGTTPQQIAAQCEGFAPAMQTQVAALSVQPMEQVLQSVSGFVLQTGMAPAELAGTARICLSAGYRTDNMDVAVGSALLLVALGERAYGELLGHHLSQGFGAAKRPDLALAWYEAGLSAGPSQVVAPGQPERSELLRRAAYAIGGRADAGAAPVPAAAPAAVALPVFPVKK
jgi:peptidoglycan hydrolase-like protein with peptidoglycan-binding domain